MRRLLVLVLASVSALGQNRPMSQRLQAALGAEAVEAMDRSDYGRVQSLLRAAEAAQPANRGELLALEGAVAFVSGDWIHARQALAYAATVHPLQEADAFTLAMAEIRAGDGNEARRELARLAAAHPASALYPYWLGRIDYDQRRYEEAIIQLRRALALDEKSSRSWDSLALCFDMEGRNEEALEAFTRAVELNRAQTPSSAWPPHNYGYLLLRLHRSSEAIAALQEALRYDGTLAEAHYHLGRAYEQESLTVEAAQQYREAMRLDQTTSDAAYALGLLERKLNHSREAALAFGEYRRRKAAGAEQ